MSSRDITNVPASIRARLLNRAKEQGESSDQILIYYAIERFLYRLSQTPQGDRLVVKGATMLRAWGTPLGRPTRDIDFLSRIDNTPAAVLAAVAECLAVEYPADGIAFDEEILVSEITVADRYPGVRAVISGHVFGAKFKLKLDIGVDDAVVPDPGWVEYPTLLDLDAPRILAYAPVTGVAEKYEAMVSLGVSNSRMKDFYDVWLLATTMEFDGDELVSALRATFGHRGTALLQTAPAALTIAFHGTPAAQTAWQAFRSKKAPDAPADLGDVVGVIGGLILPATAAAVAGGGFARTWRPSEGCSSG
jgi:hypothetical protein